MREREKWSEGREKERRSDCQNLIRVQLITPGDSEGVFHLSLPKWFISFGRTYQNFLVFVSLSLSLLFLFSFSVSSPFFVLCLVICFRTSFFFLSFSFPFLSSVIFLLVISLPFPPFSFLSRLSPPLHFYLLYLRFSHSSLLVCVSIRTGSNTRQKLLILLFIIFAWIPDHYLKLLNYLNSLLKVLKSVYYTCVTVRTDKHLRLSVGGHFGCLQTGREAKQTILRYTLTIETIVTL